MSEADFAAAVTRAAEAAQMVNRTADADDHVTQFEALTAAAYHELARRGVEVAVIEAGLGGRFDATNVIPSKVQVLTSVSLEHTRWLGPTLADIARGEARGGARPHDPRGRRARRRRSSRSPGDTASERHATLVTAEPTDMPLRAAGGFQHVNFGLAAAAAEAFLGRPLEDGALKSAAAETVVPGRLEQVGERPLTLFDGAHNPSGASALAASLPDVLGERRPRVAVIGVLEDKDAAGMLGTLLPHFDRVVFTRPANPRSLSPATLVTLAEKLGGPPAETVPEPRAALARARELAGAGRRGARHGLDLPDRGPRARGRRRAGVDAVVRRVSAVLFDLDGVLVESRESTERVWLEWAQRERHRGGCAALRHARGAVRRGRPALRPDLDAAAEAERDRAAAGGGHGGSACYSRARWRRLGH